MLALLSARAEADPSNATLVYVGLALAPPDYVLGVTLHESTHALAANVPYLLEVRTRGDVPMPRTGHWDIAEFLVAGND